MERLRGAGEMFGLGKSKSKADAALGVMDSTVATAAEKWRLFCDKVSYRDNVGLADRIAAFSVPFGDGARQNIPALRTAPDGLLLLIVAMGVEKSGTHSRAEIESALGVKLPA
jgi:hypothetical protein